RAIARSRIHGRRWGSSIVFKGGDMSRRLLLTVFLVLGCVFIPGIAAAQSAIAGVARDSSGAVLPGVTVEVSSPALIEKTRSAGADAAGQYRAVRHRPRIS